MTFQIDLPSRQTAFLHWRKVWIEDARPRDSRGASLIFQPFSELTRFPVAAREDTGTSGVPLVTAKSRHSQLGCLEDPELKAVLFWAGEVGKVCQ